MGRPVVHHASSLEVPGDFRPWTTLWSACQVECLPLHNHQLLREYVGARCLQNPQMNSCLSATAGSARSTHIVAGVVELSVENAESPVLVSVLEMKMGQITIK